MFKVQRSPWSGNLRGCCAAATWEGELSIKYYYKKLDLNRKKKKMNQGNGPGTSQTRASKHQSSNSPTRLRQLKLQRWDRSK